MFIMGMIGKLMKEMKKGKSEGKSGFEIDMKPDSGMMQMLGAFTLLQLTSLVGMTGVKFTKEDLLEMNAQLNKIRKK